MTRFHLWLMPTGGTCERLAAIIRHLSQKHGGPLFEPHVTLLGGMEGEEEEICQKTMRLAQGLRPFEVQLTKPGYQDSYFRCLYLHVQETPSLMEAHAQARLIFTQREELQFQPHLSLLYGTYAADLKEHMIESLDSHAGVVFEATAVHVIKAAHSQPKDWEKLALFPFER